MAGCREDLTPAAQVFNSPLWSLDPLSLLGGGGGAAASTAAAMALQRKKPHHPETWKISVWQVGQVVGGRVLCQRGSSKSWEGAG